MKPDLRRQALIILGALVAMIATSCNMQPVETAPAGGAPPVKTPIGPIPGAEQVVKPSPNPYAQNPMALQEGRRLFVWYNCAGCHGGHAGGGMGPSLRDVDWIYGDSDANVFSSIAEGRAHGMPAWGTRLPEDQIWKLAAYIKSLRTPLEPDPPRP
jgi:cytochrome c oxidase cbb3-type subunit 3